MTSFEQALLNAEADLMTADEVRFARERVAVRIHAHARPKVAWPLILSYACVAALFVVAALAAFDHLSDASENIVAAKGDVQPEPPVPAPLQVAPAGPASKLPVGSLVVETEGGECDLTINGKRQGKHAKLQKTLPIGDTIVICETSDGEVLQRIANIDEAGPTTVTFEITIADDSKGSLVAIAIGGSCKFTIDGEDHGTKSSLRIKVPIGMHSVACVDGSDAARHQRVMVTKDKPGIASFRVENSASKPIDRRRPRLPADLKDPFTAR